MIIYRDFIFIHMWKTGGTFVETSLLDLYHRSLPSPRAYALHRLVRRLVRVRDGRLVLRCPWLLPIIQRITRIMPIEIAQHAKRHDLPQSLRDRLILGIIRNPYDYYVSNYEYKAWRKYPHFVFRGQNYKDIYPHFPDISFAEYIDLMHRPKPQYNLDEEVYLGRATRDFFRFYGNHPMQSVERRAYFDSKQYKKDLAGVHLLRTHTLNQDLYGFLLGLGYPRERIQHILKQGKIFPRPVEPNFKPRTAPWKEYYTPELQRLVRQYDAILFQIFPEFDV
jgi:hypothetical protein